MAEITDITALLDDRDTNTKKKATRAKSETKAKSVKKLTKKEQQIAELANNTVLPDHYHTVWTDIELEGMCNWLKGQQIVAVDTETMGVNPFQDEIVGISFYAPHRGYYIPLKHKDDISHVEVEREEGSNVIGINFVKCLDKQKVIDALRPILEDRERKFILHNYKFDYHVLKNWMDIDMHCYFDTMIAQALLDENQSKRLKDMAPYYLKVEADTYSAIFGKTTFDKVPILINPHTRTGNLASYYAIKDTELTFRMYEFHLRHLTHPKLKEIHELMFDIEMPYLHIVCEAEQHGVKLDVEYLKNVVAPALHEEVETLRQKIWGFIGQINLNSPAQLSEALYIKLKLPRVNTKKPNSTDKKTLNKMKKAHEIIPLLLDYRGKVKLATAFADKLPNAVVDGRIHTSFGTIGTKTGRSSCSNPNLQQIPAKVGGLIRNAFIADSGRLLASIDFSGQELRVLAHVSGDKVLNDLFLNGKDVHSMTAVGMWNRKHPEQTFNYDQFMFCREISELFRDENSKLQEDRFGAEYLDKLVAEGKLKPRAKDPVKLKEWAQLGYEFDKIRKDAKVVKDCYVLSLVA